MSKFNNNYLFYKKINFLRFWFIFILKNSLNNRRFVKNQYRSEHLQTSDYSFSIIFKSVILFKSLFFHFSQDYILLR